MTLVGSKGRHQGCCSAWSSCTFPACLPGTRRHTGSVRVHSCHRVLLSLGVWAGPLSSPGPHLDGKALARLLYPCGLASARLGPSPHPSQALHAACSSPATPTWSLEHADVEPDGQRTPDLCWTAAFSGTAKARA